MKNLIFNFDVNDYPQKSDFIQMVRSFIKIVEKNPEFNQIDDMGKIPMRIFTLTYYMNEQDGKNAVLIIAQKEYEKNEIFKCLVQGYTGIQNETILMLLNESPIGFKLRISDNTSIKYKLGED